jgi:peptidoglycan-associated lipoprotein
MALIDFGGVKEEVVMRSEFPMEKARRVLKDVNFDFDSAELSSAAISSLQQSAAYLLQHPGIRVKIEGHCDERGTEEYNMALGARRAKSVYNFLIKQGVPASRMDTISYGESLPLDPGHNDAAWARNRRAHFSVQ